MSGARKFGAHRYNLTISGLAAGNAADEQDVFVYDAFAEQGVAAASPAPGYDPVAEQITEMNFATFTTLTGTATNFASVVVQLARAGAVVNDIRVVFSSSGVVATALTPVNMAVASGAVATGAGTGVLLVQTGIALPWTLQPGDVIVLARISNNATGLATPAVGLNFFIQMKGA
jgi:hypothetical protein